MSCLLCVAIVVGAGEAAKLIPVSTWPRVIQTAGKQIVNPSEKDCIKAGYRMIPAKPATPAGKRIVSETLVQDAKLAAYVSWQIVYEDIPAPVIASPEATTNIVVGRIQFVFSTNGYFRAVTVPDLVSVTNKVTEK